MSTMEVSLNLTQKIEADTPTQNGDWQTQNGLNTETLTHEPVDEQTQFDMDSAVVHIQLKDEPPTQGGDCQTQTGLDTETLTYELVDKQTQFDTVSTETRTQETEAEPPTPRGDVEIQTPEKASLIDAPTQSGDTGFQTQYHMEKQKHSNALLYVVSADTSPKVLARILLEHWQEKEAETKRLRKDLISTDEEKTTAQAQVKNLITAACSISEATEGSTPKDAAEKLLETRQVLDGRRSESTATWRERFSTMKNKMDLQIRLITDSMDAIQSPKVLAQSLRQAWDQVQAKNDELELDLMTATGRVKQLDLRLEAQGQDVKCLATDVGVCLAPDINHSDVLVRLRWSFDDLQKEMQDRDQQLRESRDLIAAQEEQIKDLLLKLKALTSSLDDLQPLLAAEPKKKEKKRSKKLRLKWWKRTPEQQEESNSYLEKLQEGLIKQKTTMGLLEAKMTILADQMKKEKDCLERQKAPRAELQNDVKLLQFDNQKKETLIQSLRDLVETLQKNCLNKNRGAARFQTRNAADHATVASMPTIKCEVLNINDILSQDVINQVTLATCLSSAKAPTARCTLVAMVMTFDPSPSSSQCCTQTIAGTCCLQEKLLMNERATKESMVQQLLSGSPYFPKMLGMVTIGDDLCTVMDFIGNKKTGRTYPLYGALTCRFKSNPKLGRINMLQVCEDIIKGIMELHWEGYLHNDLKSNNILLEKRGQRWHAIIIDLGLASVKDYAKQRRFSDKRRAEYRSRKIYTYMAPEVVLYGKHNSMASDIYSFGVILESIARKIKISEVAELAEGCTEQDPLKRHSMEEILLKMEAISASYY